MQELDLYPRHKNDSDYNMHQVFEKLHPDIQKALAKHNFTEPTEPQIKAIPAVLDGDNILIAPTMSVRDRTIVELGS